MTPHDLIEELRDSLIDLDADAVDLLVKDALQEGIAPIDIVEQGLRSGMEEVGRRFEVGVEFLPGLILSAMIMQQAIGILKPSLNAGQLSSKSQGRVVIGTVHGDLHDIGKNLVAMMLKINNFEVYDLGVDVPRAKFVDAVRTLEPDVLALSALLSTTLESQRRVLEDLAAAGLRSKVKVIVGGAATTPDWAKAIGSDGYSDNAVDAARVAKSLVVG